MDDDPLVGLAAALAIPPLRSLDATHPFAAAMVLLGVSVGVVCGVGFGGCLGLEMMPQTTRSTFLDVGVDSRRTRRRRR